jgi:peptide/nickel transport system ATP-binding protein
VSKTLLQIKNLVTGFDTDEGHVTAVDGVSINLKAGETLGIVGESGCGKSVTALSIMRLLPQPMGQIRSGEIIFNGRDLTKIPLADMEKIRGASISMVFQEPMTALNPVHTIGKQLGEGILLHNPELTKHQALERSIEILDKVGIPSPEVRVSEYPHQLSGGMRQRVVIAIALACNPQILIADEPTTALDVTIQAQILKLISDLQKELGMAVVLITHDLGVIAETCSSVVVMYGGKVAETGSVFDIFDKPSHPYTMGLLSSIPRLEDERKSTLTTIDGMVPSLHDMPKGCRFENRCPYAKEICRAEAPAIERVGTGHEVACHRWREIDAREA